MMYKANQLRSLPFFLPCLMLMASIPFIAGMAGEPVARGHFLMCKPGTHIFSETFTPGSVSDRWGIRAHYEIEGGMLKRTRHEPEATARTFLKGAAFHNVIIRFDFRFDGASEIRLMTGGGGGYNSGGGGNPRDSDGQDRSSGARGWEDRSYGNSSPDAGGFDESRSRRRRGTAAEGNSNDADYPGAEG